MFWARRRKRSSIAPAYLANGARSAVGQPEVEAREHEPEVLAQLRGRVALGAQREGSDVERPRGRGGPPLQGLESVRDPHPETIEDGEHLPKVGEPSELRDLLQRLQLHPADLEPHVLPSHRPP